MDQHVNTAELYLDIQVVSLVSQFWQCGFLREIMFGTETVLGWIGAKVVPGVL